MMPHQWGPLAFATLVLIAVVLRDWLRRKGQS